jgi:hypothetical protein
MFRGIVKGTGYPLHSPVSPSLPLPASPCAITFQLDSNTEARSWNNCCCGKAISVTYCECVSVALVTQHAMRMCLIILSSVGCLAVPYLSTLSHKWQHFRGGDQWTQNVFWFSLQHLSETSPIQRIQREPRKKVSLRVTLVGFSSNLNFCDRVLKNTQVSNCMKIRPVGAELFHADGQTDKHDEAKGRFSQFCERA